MRAWFRISKREVEGYGCIACSLTKAVAEMTEPFKIFYSFQYQRRNIKNSIPDSVVGNLHNGAGAEDFRTIEDWFGVCTAVLTDANGTRRRILAWEALLWPCMRLLFVPFISLLVRVSTHKIVLVIWSHNWIVAQKMFPAYECHSYSAINTDVLLRCFLDFTFFLYSSS